MVKHVEPNWYVIVIFIIKILYNVFHCLQPIRINYQCGQKHDINEIGSSVVYWPMGKRQWSRICEIGCKIKKHILIQQLKVVQISLGNEQKRRPHLSIAKHVASHYFVYLRWKPSPQVLTWPHPIYYLWCTRRRFYLYQLVIQ